MGFILTMKSNNLILITNGYPYNNGESFLKPELNFLAKEFDRVFILSISNKHINKREFPSNVIVVKSSASLAITQKINAIISVIVNIGYYQKLIKEELLNAKKYMVIGSGEKPSAFKISTVILHDLFIALKKKKTVLNIMHEYGLDSSNTLLYSYWLNSSATALSLLKRKNKDVKVVCRGHGSDIYFEMSKNGFYPFRLLNLNTLNRLFMVSNIGRSYNIDMFGNKLNNIETSYLGTFPSYSKMNQSLETKYDMIIVSVSSVIPLKRVTKIPILLSKIENLRIKWMHFGDGELFNNLKATSEELLDGNKNIEYQLKGNVNNKDLMEFYLNNKIDLFLSLSSSEGIPVSMMEAMSFGIPVLSTDVGGISELVNSENGFLVDSSVNYREIIGVIESYMKMNSSQKQLIRSNAFKHWNKYFNAEKNFPIFAKQLKQLL